MISGYICIRNGDELDYCWRECVQSLLPICEEVVICDRNSDDGTSALAIEWAAREPKIRVINFDEAIPKAAVGWMVRWMNWTRSHLRHRMQLFLDADEILDPSSYGIIRRLAARAACATFQRNTYFGDHRHMAPEGVVNSDRVARLGPSGLWMPIDAPTEDEHPNVATNPENPPGLLIHHYGFLRKPEAFYRKAKIVQEAFFGVLDPRCEKAHQETGDWRTHGDWFDGQPLRTYWGGHPLVIREWLRERGYE